MSDAIASACFRSYLTARLRVESMRDVGERFGVSQQAVSLWMRGSPPSRMAVIVAGLLAERDAHAVCELAAGLPDGALAPQVARSAAISPAPTPKPVRTVRRRRKPAQRS